MNGNAAFTGTGKMGNGLSVDGSGDSAESGTTSIDTGGTWSIEAWMKTDDTSDGTIVFLGDFDGNDEDDDLSRIR